MLLPSIYRLIRTVSRQSSLLSLRSISTLPDNPHVYVFSSSNSYVLSYLPTKPPTRALSIGSTTEIPPTPQSFTENPAFLPIVQTVLAEHAASDPQLQAQAAAFASSSASLSNFNNLLFSQRDKRTKYKSDSVGATGFGSKGGWIHVSDLRAPPAYGRIAWPEDILGSLEVGSNGKFISSEDERTHVGNYQPSGTYRIVTLNGIMKLSDFLRQRLVDKLAELEQNGPVFSKS